MLLAELDTKICWEIDSWYLFLVSVILADKVHYFLGEAEQLPGISELKLDALFFFSMY